MGLINEENKNKNLNGPQATSKGPNANNITVRIFFYLSVGRRKDPRYTQSFLTMSIRLRVAYDELLLPTKIGNLYSVT